MSSQNGDSVSPPATLSNSPTPSAPQQQQPKTPQKHANTRDRLFGIDSVKASPKKSNPTYSSSIFDSSASDNAPRTPKKTIKVIERNPITGEVKTPAGQHQQITV